MMTMKRLWLAAVLTLCVGATASAYDLTVVPNGHGVVGFSVGGTTVTTAEAGEVVTITVTPDEGYTTKSVTARAYTTWEAAARRAPGLIDDITATKQQDGTWQFTMPEANVQVKVEYYADLPETNDGSWIAANDGQTADIRLGRTLQTGGWNTFAAPFAIDDPASIGISAVKELQSATMENNTLTLNFDNASSIEAGKPYLVKVTNAVVNPTFAGVIVSKETAPFTSQYVDFIPTLGKTTIEGSDTKAVLFLAAGNKLLHPESLPADMKGFRAYFQLKEAAEVKSFVLDFGDGDVATGLLEIGQFDNSQSDNSVYDLQGRRFESKPAQKGVYVKNGKKVIIK